MITRLKRRIKLDSSVVKGIGDDCAVLRFTKDKYQLFTCDMLVEGIDFKTKTDPYLIGRKALAVSMSDIAACGGIPKHYLVALGIPKSTSVKFIDRFFSGMKNLARKNNINFVGGDISKSGVLTIDLSMLGEVEKKNLVLRSNANPDDIIFVTGSIGGSIHGKHLKFCPRIKEARLLVKNFKINSMIDISDGLTQDLSHILKTSKKGAIIYEELIPLSSQAGSLKEALNSGEDFELLFTMAPKEAKRLISKKMEIFSPIGKIVDGKYGMILVNKKGGVRKEEIKGFRHF